MPVHYVSIYPFISYLLISFFHCQVPLHQTPVLRTAHLGKAVALHKDILLLYTQLMTDTTCLHWRQLNQLLQVHLNM